MRFLFLNQYFPPDPAPTGALLHELVARLESEGHSVDFVSARQTYRAGQGKGGRMRREAAALGRMLLASLCARRADVIVSATSPPCLLVAATVAARWHGARSVHWAMDLYPELAVALGEVPAGGVARSIERVMGWCYRRTDRVVALDEDMAERLRRYGVESAIVRPWVFAPIVAEMERAVAADAGPETPWTWIYSGNLGRAHEWETLLAAQALIEQRDPEVRLLFQGGGPAVAAANTRAQRLGLTRCEWRGYVDEAALPASLLRCGACAVTQRPEAQGLLWPSKLALLLTMPRPIVWVGPTDGAVARLLRTVPRAGIFAPGAADGVAEWVLAQRAMASSGAALDAGKHREEMLATWMTIVSAIGAK